MRKRFTLPVPTDEERQRAIQLVVAVKAIYKEADRRCREMREHEASLEETQYGEFRGYTIIRNYLLSFWKAAPILDALQRTIQDLCESYRSHTSGCQEEIVAYEQNVAKWEQDNWCNYYRGPNEKPTEIEKEQFRTHYRREYGPEKSLAEIKIMQDYVNRLETAYHVSNEGY